MMYKQLLKTVSFLLIGVFLITSCSDDPASLNSDEPPQLPPIESMRMDFSTFDNYQQPKNSLNSANSNFAQAAVRAFVLKSVVDLNLAIPRALLEAASNSDAEFNEEGEWVWSYSHTAGEDNYGVRLIASRENDAETSWQFFVTNSTLNIEDKLFFSGTTSGNGSQGTWTYYNLMSDSQEAVSNTEWTVSGEDEDEVSLRLEVVSDRFDNEGDFIEYTFDGTVKNAVYYDAGEDATTELQWNVETNEGYLIAPNYNNGEQACWDENFEDVNCS